MARFPHLETGKFLRRVILKAALAVFALFEIPQPALAQPCVPVLAGIVSWWSGESNAVDNIGGNNGNLANAASFAPGQVGTAFAFDGVSDYIRVPDAPNLRFSTGLTAEAWIYLTNTPGSQAGAVLTKYDTAQGVSQSSFSFAIQADFRPSFLLSANGQNGAAVIVGSNTIPTNVWTHVAATYDGQSVSIYVNGNLQVTLAYSGGIFSGTDDVGIGATVGLASGNTFLSPFPGYIDEPTLYNRGLSATEIQAIFNAGTNGKCPENLPPVVYSQPANRIVFPGGTTTFLAYVAGSPPLDYQWLFNGSNIAGATDRSLTITNAQLVNAGVYSFVASNSFNSSGSSNCALTVNFVTILANGSPVTNINGGYSYIQNVTIKITNSFTSGLIYYTLDGSIPTTNSILYAGQFVLTNTAVVRTLGYSPDLAYSAISDAYMLTVLQYVNLVSTNSGGGTLNQVGSRSYVQEMIAFISAEPANGWRFLQWTGDTSGTVPSTSVLMTRNKTVYAVFGTTVSSTASSNGTLLFNPPAGGYYPYGCRLTVTPVPQPGYFFSSWSGSVSGTADPLEMSVTIPTPVITASYLPLPAGRATLSVPTTGNGYVTLSPYGGIYYTNDNVTVTAIPDAGYSFLNWSGDSSGTNNPLVVSMNQSKVIYANFSDNNNSLVVYPVTGPGVTDGVAVDLFGQHGIRYRLDASVDLSNWTTLYNLNNFVGTIHYIDIKATNMPKRYYRAALLP